METKTQTQHTPGPWTAHKRGDGRYDISGGGMEPEGVAIANGTRHEQGIANATLIAAAPDMLEALRAVIEGGNIDRGSHWVVDIEDIEKVRAAIAKATGA